MKNCFLFTLSLLFLYSTHAQVSYSANQLVQSYMKGFHAGLNNGYYPKVTNEQIAELAAGNPDIDIAGAGANAMRVGFTEEIAELFGYDILLPLFEYYNRLGMREHTMIVQGPIDWHRDEAYYCPTARSALFKNLYLPVWDNGANGTPYNDDNYFAAYLYQMVSLYKSHVRFWEIWNEPGFDLSGALGWLPPNASGNWWTANPQPCDYILRAPVQHYIRTLRIAWEVVKTLDPDAYVTCSGVGYPSFLDAILRQTDNPDQGLETPEFPLKGGAYFDAVGFHSYPHIDGSVRYWDNNCSCMVNSRHSDGAADGTIRTWKNYEFVLKNHGYDGQQFPRKIQVITEGNVPAKAVNWGEFLLGGVELQRNYIIKAVVACHKNNIVQYDLFQLFNLKDPAEDAQPFEVMGVYEKNIAGTAAVRSGEGIAYSSVQAHLFGCQYDAWRSAQMQLPAHIDGGAFLTPEGKYVYVLWAKTQTDQSEAATANFHFPLGMGVSTLFRREWNFSETKVSTAVSSENILLSEVPAFFSETNEWANTPPVNTAKIDLELSLSAQPMNPVAGEPVLLELRIENKSATVADTVEVGDFMNFSKTFLRDRLTYLSHNAPAGSSYDPQQGLWIIPGLSAGGSAVLRLQVVSRHGGPYRVFAQVVKSGKDADSAPLNGSIHKIPFEDDEAMLTLNEGPAAADQKADLVVEATKLPQEIQAGQPFTLRYMLRNNGRSDAAASTLRYFLSKDDKWDSTDQELDSDIFNAMGASAYQLKERQLSLPLTLINGAWNLLFFCDYLNQSDEYDECNVFARNIVVTGGLQPCIPQASVLNLNCHDNQTPADPSDDYFDFELLVLASGNCSNSWNSDVFQGAYGQAQYVGPFPMSQSVLTLGISDSLHSDTAIDLNVQAPLPCFVSSVPVPGDVSAVKIWPNPASHFVHIETAEKTSFSLFNTLGIRVRSFESSGKNTISLNGLAPGLYQLAWSTRTKAAGRFKLVILKG